MSEDVYSYSEVYPDRLTSFNGKAITYDINGCVKTYGGWRYEWNKGRLKYICQIDTDCCTETPPKYTFKYNGYAPQKLDKLLGCISLKCGACLVF